jgi:hypothetical protein
MINFAHILSRSIRRFRDARTCDLLILTDEYTVEGKKCMTLYSAFMK